MKLSQPQKKIMNACAFLIEKGFFILNIIFCLYLLFK